MEKNKMGIRSEKLTQWWHGRNGLFSMLCQEEFTNREVVLLHAGLIVMLAVAIAAGAE